MKGTSKFQKITILKVTNYKITLNSTILQYPQVHLGILRLLSLKNCKKLQVWNQVSTVATTVQATQIPVTNL